LLGHPGVDKLGTWWLGPSLFQYRWNILLSTRIFDN
jgi:hypothetical protein